MKFVVILSTCPNLKEAQKIAKFLVEKRLAACVQISSPVKSIYRWRGRLSTAKEVQLWIKTRASLVSKATQAISALHSYEVPEIISIPIDQGLKKYLNWIRGQASKVPG